MIRVSLTFMALSAVTVIYNAANRASLDTALQLALMLVLGCVMGLLYARLRVGRQ